MIGYSYIHSAVDDHSRLAYSEVLPDERQHTAIAFWQRANAFFADHGITVERVLTDNGACYKSRLFTQSLTAAGISHKKIRPYRPQTNGKVERFNRTLLDEWAYLRPYASNHERKAALSDFLHTYNHHRCHTALGGHPPITRVNNVAGQYNYPSRWASRGPTCTTARALNRSCGASRPSVPDAVPVVGAPGNCTPTRATTTTTCADGSASVASAIASPARESSPHKGSAATDGSSRGPCPGWPAAAGSTAVTNASPSTSSPSSA